MASERTFKVATHAYSALRGYFAIYKPVGLSLPRVLGVIHHNLLTGLNGLEQPPPGKFVKFIRSEETGEPDVVAVPNLADSVLVSGPKFKEIKLGWLGTALDARSSGVVVMAARGGSDEVMDSNKANFLPKVFHVKGQLGVATDSFDDSGRILERTSFRHVTREKLDRVVSATWRGQQKIMHQAMGLDLESQEAYQLATKGLLWPVGPSAPIIQSMKCIEFDPPHFTLEIQGTKVFSQYLRKLVHEIGLELHSTAVSTQVRRIQDGAFTLQHSLLRKDWHLNPITTSIQECQPLMRSPENFFPLQEMEETYRDILKLDKDKNEEPNHLLPTS